MSARERAPLSDLVEQRPARGAWGCSVTMSARVGSFGRAEARA